MRNDSLREYLADSPVIARGALANFCRSALVASGAAEGLAQEVADLLVEADAEWHPAHGVHLLDYYLDDIANGFVDAKATPRSERMNDWAVRIDGAGGFGQCAAREAVREVRALALAGRPAVASISHSGHVGRLAPYVRDLAEDGNIAIMTAAYALDDREAAVSAFPGGRRLFGTNPIAVAAPDALVVDLSTGETSVYEILFRRLVGLDLPSQCVFDAAGLRTSDIASYIDGGAIAPLSGHKGVALSLAALMIGSLAPSSPGQIGGISLLAIPLRPLRDRSLFRDDFATLINALEIEASASSGRLRLPGRYPANDADTVRVAEPVLERLQIRAAQLGLKAPCALAEVGCR